jgi:hypothetical protein
LGARVRELAILTTARELDSQFEWAAHEPEALREGISRDIIEIIKHRLDTSSLDEADRIVIELPRDLRREEAYRGDLRPGIATVRPPRFGRSRCANGKLRRDGSTVHCL